MIRIVMAVVKGMCLNGFGRSWAVSVNSVRFDRCLYPCMNGVVEKQTQGFMRF
jgi:hypothetical protein